MIKTEEWKKIPGCYNYEASSHGRIRRSRPGLNSNSGISNTWVGKIRKLTKDTGGYYQVCLTHEGKASVRRVSHLVTAAFLGEKPQGICVNHIDGDKANDNIENLEYVTHSENTAHAYRTGLIPGNIGENHPSAVLTEVAVRDIRARLERGDLKKEIAADNGISASSVLKIERRITWKHVT